MILEVQDQGAGKLCFLVRDHCLAFRQVGMGEGEAEEEQEEEESQQ